MASKNKHVQEYIKQYPKYNKYVDTLKDLLTKLLDDKKILFQTVQGRAKEIKSFKDNIHGNKYKGKPISIFSDVIDLAGCRVIFYLESELKKFSYLLHSEFENQEIKDKWTKDDYNALHFIGTLKKNRAKLPEYKEFKELTFEIQLTTVLFHGWNELEHDTFYKDKAEIKKHYPNKFNKLKDKAAAIMKKNIKEAQYGWENIIAQYNLTAKGIDISDLDKLKSLTKVTDNNEIHKQLKLFKDITEEIEDLRESYTPQILIPILTKILDQSKSNKYKVDKTAIYTFDGKTYSDVATVVIELLNLYKYNGLKDYIEFLDNIYPYQPIKVREKIEENIAKTAAYNSNILKYHGFYVQNTLINHILGWDKDKQIGLLNIICVITEAILSTDFTHISSDYKVGEKGGVTHTFQKHILQNSKELESLRNKCINLLIELYSLTSSFENKVNILKKLEIAMYDSFYSSELKGTVKGNIKKIIKFYLQILNKSSFEILLLLDEQIGRIFMLFKKEKIDEFKEFKAVLDKQKEYQIYKVLVGYDLRYDKELKWSEAKELREKEINKYITQISKKNADKWCRRLLKIAYTCKNIKDFNMFNYYQDLLILIGKKKPYLAFKLLNNEKSMTKFFGSIIKGLLNSKDKIKIEKKMTAWQKKNKHLGAIISALSRTEMLTNIRALEIYKIIKSIKDKQKKIRLLEALLYPISKFKKKDKTLILKLIYELSTIKSYRWLLWICENEDLLDSFTEKDWDKLLDNLIEMNSLDGWAKRMLAFLAKKHPSKFVGFFEKRLNAESKEYKVGWEYTAIPYDSMHLEIVLKDKEEEIVNDVFKWFNKADKSWHAVHFLHSMYPELSDSIIKKMNKTIDSGDKEMIDKIIYPMFGWYQGDCIEPFILKLVKKLPKNKKMWRSLFGYLSNPGSVSGNANESLFANAYKAKLRRASQWKLVSEKENNFQKDYKKYLQNQISMYEKEHEKEISKFKDKYGKDTT